MIIRLLEPDDSIQGYLECVNSLNSSGVELSDIEQIRGVLSLRPSNILTFVGVLEDGKIVSTATVIMEKKLRYHRLCCHIEDVGVHPSYRKHGYGKRMVEYCISMAQKNNCYKVKLNCSKDLIGFYEKMGFETDNFGLSLRINT